jgi:glutamine cyclotransferase
VRFQVPDRLEPARPVATARGRFARAAAWLALSMVPAALAANAPAPGSAPTAHSVPVYGFEIVHAYPHDVHAFTEGLFYAHGYLYESTGLEGQSSIRKERLTTGEVLQKTDIDAQYFGEGIVEWKQQLISLTWKSQVGFVFDLTSLKLLHRFHYPGEGWALTHDDKQLIMSDGTSQLRFLDPHTLRETGRLGVTLGGRPLDRLNELEWIKGRIYANVWQTNWIVQIDPRSGEIDGLINLEGLLDPAERVAGQTDVLNGIAYDAQADRLFVTGKNWPKLFEIRLHRVGEIVPRPPSPASR